MRENSIEDAPFGPFHWRMALFGSGGWFVDGYILTSIAIALTLLRPEFGLGSFEVGALGAIALVGIFFGAIIGGPIADKHGRRALLTLDILLFIVASVAQFYIDSMSTLMLLRFILGVAIGLDYAVATPYMSELTPRKYRGPILAIPPTIWFFGAVVAYIATYFMLDLGAESWRWMLASGALPAFIVLLLRIGVPESPRWLLSKGRREEAKEVVKRVYGSNARIEDIEGEKDNEAGGFSELVRRGYLGRTLFVGFLWLIQMSPVFAIFTFAPDVLKAFGMGEGYLGSIVLSILFCIGAAPSVIFLLNGWGRRPLAIWSFVAITLSFLILAIPGIPLALTILAFLSYALCIGAAQTLQGVYPGELFPTGVRSTGAGIAAAMSRVGAAISTFLLPVMLTGVGINAVMLILALLSAVGIWLCIAYAPETKGRTLAEINEID